MIVNNPIQSKNPAGYGFFPVKLVSVLRKSLPVNTKKGPPQLKAVINI